MNGWVYAGFDITYATMGVEFDTLYYESDTYLIGRDRVLEGVERGIFQQREDGSVWVDLTGDGLDEKLRSQGRHGGLHDAGHWNGAASFPGCT